MGFWRDTFFAAEPDPRKRETGTSLQSKGAVVPSGVTRPEQGSSRGGLVRDIVPQLASRSQAINIYEEMANSDAAVDISLRAAKMPVMGADYFVEAFDDAPENQDIREFVEFNLLNGTSSPFLLILDDVLRMFEYGYSVLEQVYEEREWAPKRQRANRKKYTMLKKLAARPTPTVKEIKYDNNGGPTGIVHSAMQADGKPKDVEIPIEKLIIFSNNKKGGNLEGKSLLRTAYRPWVFKSNLLNIDGIQKERHGMGFPIIELPPGATTTDKDAAHELVRNVRTNEFGGAVLPFGFKMSFADIQGQPVDVMRSIEHHDGQILLNTMTQFLLLGLEGSGGGRATSGSHQDMFNKSQRFVGNLICDYFNLYCIPKLVAYNFPTDKFPKLRVRNIGETKDLQQWASAMANLKSEGLVNYTAETEVWVREIIDAPLAPGKPEVTESQRGTVTSQNDGNSGAATDNAEG